MNNFQRSAYMLVGSSGATTLAVWNLDLAVIWTCSQVVMVILYALACGYVRIGKPG